MFCPYSSLVLPSFTSTFYVTPAASDLWVCEVKDQASVPVPWVRLRRDLAKGQRPDKHPIMQTDRALVKKQSFMLRLCDLEIRSNNTNVMLYSWTLKWLRNVSITRYRKFLDLKVSMPSISASGEKVVFFCQLWILAPTAYFSLYFSTIQSFWKW